MSNFDKTEKEYPFSVYNLAGKMKIQENCVTKPIFCHETYTIKVAFDYHNDYSKVYRRQVLWNFGDGTQKEGVSAEHFYKKPGNYTISCLLFDFNRKVYENTFKIEVVVKELIPTTLNILEKNEELKCSKIEKLAHIEVKNSNTLIHEINLKCERIFSEKDNQVYYNELDDSLFSHMKKYWTYLKNNQIFYYNRNKVYSNYLEPSDIFSPKYRSIYAKFYDEGGGRIGVSLFQVIPTLEEDEEIKTIKILNPNGELNFDKEDFLEKEIIQIYQEENLPAGVKYAGRRGFVDVYFRSDYIGEIETTIYFDIENHNITGDLYSSPNYLNLITHKIKSHVTNNSVNDIKIAISLDSFLKNDKITDDNNVIIDQFVEPSLFKGLNHTIYMFPIILYKENEILYDKEKVNYYVPKDFIISCEKWKNVDDISWLLTKNILLTEKEITLTGTIKIDNKDIPLEKTFKVCDLDKVQIPFEKQVNVNMNDVLNAYMNHPMFNECENLKDGLLAIYGNGYIQKFLTKSKNFIDNNLNVKTCYLHNLYSQLKMMGEDLYDYEQVQFNGINELKDFVRFLSMNHSDLVGHEVDKNYDIKITQVYKGKNVGNEISDYKEKFTETCEIIIRDTYTNQTKICQMDKGKCLGDYDISWGWNLILPDEFHKICNILKDEQKDELSKIKENIMKGYYKFYKLNTVVEKQLLGNFLDEKCITKEVKEKWDTNPETWGLCHEILMKILINSAKLNNNDE